MAVVNGLSTLRGEISGFSGIFGTVRGELQVILRSSGYFLFLQQVVLTDEPCGLLFSPLSLPQGAFREGNALQPGLLHTWSHFWL